MPPKIQVPLQPKQSDLYDLVENSRATWIGYGGSRGGAKSHGARAVMLLRRLKYPGTRGLIFRRKNKQIRENHLEPLFRQYPFMRAWYNESKHELKLPNDSAIVFGVAEHPGDIDDYQGHEYMDICVDEATHLADKELQKLKASNRWPGMPDRMCKYILTMNPGNVGHAFIQRVFIKKNYQGEERPEDYVFLQAFGWDNVEWARAALAEARMSDKEYYAFSNEERIKFFINRTQYGRDLNALPQALRIGWLFGNWDKFAGQYYDVFDPDKHVIPCRNLDRWLPRWLGIDWGRTHNAVCLWNAQDGAISKTYREMAVSGRSPKELAQGIVDRTTEDERKRVDAIYLSHDAFAERTSPDTVALQMGEVFRQYGMPEPTQADKDVAGGAALLYELLRSCQWQIDPSCESLIECLPMVTRDEEQWEKPIKFEGDDAYEAARYSLKMRLSPRAEPFESKLDKAIAAIPKVDGNLDYTAINITRMQMAEEEKKRRPVRLRSRYAQRQW